MSAVPPLCGRPAQTWPCRRRPPRAWWERRLHIQGSHPQLSPHRPMDVVGSNGNPFCCSSVEEVLQNSLAPCRPRPRINRRGFPTSRTIYVALSRDHRSMRRTKAWLALHRCQNLSTRILMPCFVSSRCLSAVGTADVRSSTCSFHPSVPSPRTCFSDPVRENLLSGSRRPPRLSSREALLP